MVDLSIGIVTYNNADKICNLLESIYAYTSGLTFQIYIFDNHSTDDTVEKVCSRYPEVEIVENPVNIGFGAGHNQALTRIDSTYHAVVNPDILLHTDVFTDLKNYMDQNPECVLASPKVLNEDGTEQYLPKRNPTLKYMILGKLGDRIPYFHKYRVEYTRSDEPMDIPTPIDFATGCFMFLRTAAFREVGGFDENFFMYCEDADLTRRLWQVGQVMFVPDAEVIHQWERGSTKNLHLMKIHYQSIFYYKKKWRKVK